jgi:hypothetical protein
MVIFIIFYADLEKPNIMDEKPFFTEHIKLKRYQLKNFRKFSKMDIILKRFWILQRRLKYIKAIRNEFEKEIQEPSDEMVLFSK